MKTSRVLVVDDDPQAQPAYAAVASRLPQIELVVETNPASAGQRLAGESFDTLVAAGAEGLGLLRTAREREPSLPVILIANHPSIAEVTSSLRAGANDHLTKPLSTDELVASLERVLVGRRLGDEHALLRRQIERPYSFDEFIGASPAMRKVFELIEQVAASDVDVLVIGETGTGKELVARSIHRRSRRADEPFVPVDCGAIPDNLLESEFFGHERGAFTGANERRIGLLEFADGGTLFLDELGELPLALQAKLLRTLQERKIRRVGGREEISVDVRIVAATSRNLEEMIRQKLFREDLYYRINVVRIDLPPLCERGDDLGLLAERLAWRYSKEMGKPVHGLTPEAFQVLQQYRWPGNVRELQNVIRRSIALTRDTLIGINDLPDQVVFAAGERQPGGETAGAPLGFFASREQHVARFERDYLTSLLKRHQGHVKTAARDAGLPRGTLYRLMKNHGLDGADFRAQ
ncbi:MAG: sigma-54-dependent Fis family transcriptional regulator [Planctomycetaceae bacterium]|nr:sigma-54-dependent Fis family transcriptional regulator [Planctomycetaceae bacterium]